MVVPGRVEAAAVLLALDPPAWLLRHSRGVAEVAAFLASRAVAHGHALDRLLVESAGLLHDVDKALPAGQAARRLGHGYGSADWLARHGYAELGPVVAAHPVTRLLERADASPGRPSLEARIVAYADKRVGQRLGPMEDRLRGWRRRYPRAWGSADGSAARMRADALEAEVCTVAGLRPRDVRRLRWTARALAAARRSAAA